MAGSKGSGKAGQKSMEEEIRAAAEEIYRKRLAAGQNGDELSDWLEAEKIVKGSKPPKGKA